MHHYQPIPDLESGETPPPPPHSAPTTAATNSLSEKDIDSQLSPPPKYESRNHQQQQEDKYLPSLQSPAQSSSPIATLPSAPKYLAFRKAWVILSLPITIAVLISTSVFVCMSSSSSSSVYTPSVHPSSSVQQQQQHQDLPCVTEESSFSFDGSDGVLSSSWPRIPLSPVITVSVPASIVSDATSDKDTTFQSPTAVEAVVAQTDEVIGMNENGGDERMTESEIGGLGGIEIISVVDPVVTSAVGVVVAAEVDTEQQAIEGLREDDDDDEEEDDGEWEDGEEKEEGDDMRVEGHDDDILPGAIDATATMTILEQVVTLEALIDQAILIPETANDNDDGMNLDLSEDGLNMGDGDSVILLSLRKNDNDDEAEDEEEDEDEQDHFPANIGKDDIDEDEGGDEDDDDGQQNEKPRRKGGKDTNNNSNSSGSTNQNDMKNDTGISGSMETNKHKHKHQDQNANLGGTGGNGPILLCSSKSCLPSLRDSILSKLSVQVRQVMDHLRSRHTLVHMMSLTAPQTKESLMAGQEELVQQLEDRIMKDLRDWVNGVGRKSPKFGDDDKKVVGTSVRAGGSVASAIRPGLLATESTQSVADDKEATGDMEGLFLDADEFEEGEDDGSGVEGFHMASLSFEDPDDDDEDHEDDSFTRKSAVTAAAKANKNKPKKKTGAKLQRRDTTTSSSSPSSPSTGTPTSSAAPREYFLSADKLLMRQEWSRWIAHWVHHTKLLILSHTLATQSLVEMNRIAISGENVVPLDQRHWSWNLDKALATVMVASEMICGGPASAKDVKIFLSTLSMSSEISESTAAVAATSSGEDDGSDIMSPKALAITLNAQKCIESWSDELEVILQRTATNA
ncbi:hypothetical protein BG015_008241 [Linnemannia schmuckeri]|uniref:Transmembrane protein n=1 Tax=Linnemannia schmuckeri TaxID=64567 RepID=A0A9P5VA98_9FUNG|nr:hypothetical protein BG015_008241 [Linnemannia schmuckeri]